MQILLTGGAGFIGSALSEALIRRGDDLTIVDNLDSFYSRTAKLTNLAEIRTSGAFAFYDVDIRDGERLRDVFSERRPEVVVHLAARAGVRPSIEAPLLYTQVNIDGTTNLLELCRDFQVPKFVFGSSSSVYGVTDKAPFSESHTDLRPISPYAATKLAGEMMCHTYAHLFDIEAVCLRFFTVYGRRQRPDLAIHKFVALLEAGKPIPFFGDGRSGRDYTYVDDIVAGILSAITFDTRRKNRVPFELFNLGNSHPITLECLVTMLENATGRNAVRHRLPIQPGDVPLTWADISKARCLLGYEPATSLEDGLKDFVSWFRNVNAVSRAA